MFCSACGTKNSDDGNFCKQCGLGLGKPAANRISEKDFERAMPVDDQLASMLERAYRARKDGDRLEAISLCHEALGLRPNSTSCHSLLGQLYEQGGERELAIEQYEQVLALNPGSIADRVKLDELKGDVPSLIVPRRTSPTIVVADSEKSAPQIDYRVPAFVLAGVALMVLGGLFTMQILSHQQSTQRTQTGPFAQNNVAPPTAPGTATANTASAAPTGPNQQSNPYSGFTGIGAQPQPIIIENGQPAPPRDYSQPRTQAAPIIEANNGRDGSTPTRLDPDTPDGGPVQLQAGNSGSHATDHGSDSHGGNAKITVLSQGSSVSDPPPVTPTTGSDSRKFVAMATSAAEQGQYETAGGNYLKALDGAGDDTAYVYRRAAWCFEKAGNKATAVSLYQHGIEAAQKLVQAGSQVEIAKNLIRECQTGIKACAN